MIHDASPPLRLEPSTEKSPIFNLVQQTRQLWENKSLGIGTVPWKPGYDSKLQLSYQQRVLSLTNGQSVSEFQFDAPNPYQPTDPTRKILITDNSGRLLRIIEFGSYFTLSARPGPPTTHQMQTLESSGGKVGNNPEETIQNTINFFKSNA